MQRCISKYSFTRRKLRYFHMLDANEQSWQPSNQVHETGGSFRKFMRMQFSGGFEGGVGANLAGFRRYTENAVRASANVTLSACLWPPPRGKHKVSLRTLGKSPSG